MQDKQITDKMDQQDSVVKRINEEIERLISLLDQRNPKQAEGGKQKIKKGKGKNSNEDSRESSREDRPDNIRALYSSHQFNRVKMQLESTTVRKK